LDASEMQACAKFCGKVSSTILFLFDNQRNRRQKSV
jgi:hypothetical protein